MVCTEQCCEWLSPSLRIFAKPFEILLEGQTDLLVITAGCHDFCNGMSDRINCSVERTPFGQVWIKTVTHHGHSICFSVKHRKLGYHRLNRCHLIFSAVRQSDAACTNGAVKHLHKSFLGAYIQIFQCINTCFRKALWNLLIKEAADTVRNFHIYIIFLMSPIGIQKCTGEIHDLFSSPGEY